MTISGMGSTGGFDPSNMATRMMKDLDKNGDKNIDKSEFTAGLTAKGVSADDAAKLFDKIDTKGTGKITQSDIETSLKASGGSAMRSVSGMGSAGGFDPSKMATRMMKDFDKNGDNTLDKSEFTAGLTAKGVSADDAAKLFDKIDTKGTGKITQSDIETSLKTSGGKGAPPAGGAAKSGSTAKSSDSTSYDKKDTNQDGTVSAAEEFAYALKHPETASTEKSFTSYNQNGYSAKSAYFGSYVNLSA
ncbi:EF-hand domain-containing protein [Candidatus Magnetomonas plexicatena]|uniref:EF-hand domain-containing protein n=1 Tax=Candidatus Magnetomonas plexicatena TaxID=2552947 RepID=UPI001C768CE8|nr:hypothetical protein E2O03_003055 [Nitrospirales bacterium LBB_01]